MYEKKYKCRDCRRLFGQHEYDRMRRRLVKDLDIAVPVILEQRAKLGLASPNLTVDFVANALLEGEFVCTKCFAIMEADEPFAEYLNKLFGTEGPKVADLDLFEWKEIYK